MNRIVTKVCMVLALLMLLASVGLAGCSSGRTTSTMSLATAPAGGGAYIAGIGLAEILNRYAADISVTPEATVGGQQNVELMGKGLAELALLSSIDLWEAVNGVQPRFTEKAQISVLMPGHLSAFHRVVRTDSSIGSLADLKGSGAKIWNISMLRTAGGVYLADLNALQKYYGFTDGDLTSVSYYTLSSQVDAMKEGRHDLISYPTGVPNASITQLCTEASCRFISIDADTLNNICEDNPFFFPYVLPAGTYSGQTEEVNMVAYSYFLVVKNDMDEDLVYEMAKALYDHYDELAAIHPSLQDYSVEYIARNTVAPWHPGVVKYFKEKGVWTAELEATHNRLLSDLQ